MHLLQNLRLCRTWLGRRRMKPHFAGPTRVMGKPLNMGIKHWMVLYDLPIDRLSVYPRAGSGPCAQVRVDSRR